MIEMDVFFFFSSRRRHTRCSRDWSSDVCSSDLKDVKFHNGKPLTSADVVASLKCWGTTASTGKAIFKVVEAVEAKGPNAIEIRLKEPSGSLLTVLAQV